MLNRNLIWRPVKKIATISTRAVQASKHFVSRFTPSSLSNAFSQDSTKPSRQQETYQKFEYKKGNEVKKSQIVYEEMGMALWERIAPTGFNETVNIERLHPEEKEILREWLLLGNTENKRWIQSEYGAMI